MAITVTEITKTIGTGLNKQVVVIWYEYENGDRYKQITASFELDGRKWPAGTVLMKRAGAQYAVAMSPRDMQIDLERRAASPSSQEQK